jgi:GntR family transcriptional regulator/MocR family aminotransferase
MANAPAILGLIALERRKGPLQAQLYQRLREDILAGRLAPGTRLPASRTIAADLGVARNTVVAALDRLAHEGYVTARTGSGTRVAALPPEALSTVRAPAEPPAEGGRPPRLARRTARWLAARRPLADPARSAFQPGFPAVDEFPHDVWARLLQRHARRPGKGTLGYAHAVGLPALRAAIVRYLTTARGVSCRPEQVFVVAGAQAGLDLTCRLVLDPGDSAWIEEPGYLGARGALVGAGAALVPVPVDAEGVRVDVGAAKAPRARLAYTTPSHQFPLGMTLSLSRRLALLEWAARAGAWIVEDDYDSEYRYGGRPIAAMQGLDAGGRVIYLGTFSKTMLPALRVGYVIVPEALVEPVTIAIRHTGHSVPVVVQAALADFLDEGHFATHVRRMRGLYARRQAALVAAVARLGGTRLVAEATDAGLQLAARLLDGTDDRALSTALDAAGVVAPPLAAYHLGTPRVRGLLMGYAAVPEREIAAAVLTLGRVLDGVPARPGARAAGRARGRATRAPS